MQILKLSLGVLLCSLISINSLAFLGGCTLNDVTFQVEPCEDEDPDLSLFFDITGGCYVTEICLLQDGTDIGCADVSELLIEDGEGVTFTALLSDTFYEFTIYLSDGSSFGGYSFMNGSCNDYICDCAGTEHTIGLLDQGWLGDGFADDGQYQWEGQPVDFNCETWGYDCGDIAGAPTSDPYNVCNGGIPPNNGCGIEECFPTYMTLAQGDCADNDQDGTITPVINMTFGIDGTCMVEELCFSENGGVDYTCIDLPSIDQIVFDGQGLNLINTIPDIEYLFYFSTGGNTSQVYSFMNGNCDTAIEGCTNEYAVNYNPDATVENGTCQYDDTICDCAGSEHTIGVLAWLGDTFADDASYEWDGVPVDFNCSDWGYDCGDIIGAPGDDPYNVCTGGLPPNNGCELIGDCSIEISQVEQECVSPDQNPNILINFDITGNCGLSEFCYSIDGGSYTCEDISWIPDGFGYSFQAPQENALYTFYATLQDGSVSTTNAFPVSNCDQAVSGCTNEYAVNYNPDASIEDGSCIYDETICDCIGNEHTIGVLSWLGDTYADNGAFQWDGVPVDFNCSDWGYDCGDIDGAPEVDPYDVCSGGLPPNNGCQDIGDQCLPISLDLTQGLCADDNEDGILTPTIGIAFNIEGDCAVEDLCFSIDGENFTCLTLSEFGLNVGNGEAINLVNTTPNALYSFYFTTEDGISSIQTFQNGSCDGVITGCTNEYADNYNPEAESDDGSCSYSESICDCAGTQHTLGVLTWLGDGFEDIGGTEYFWDGLPVDFGCAAWGYDCGDIEGAPNEDPYNVCGGGLPPENGCTDLTDCTPYEMTLEEDCFWDEDNQVFIPRILVTTFFDGECLVEQVCEETGGVENCYTLADFDIFLESGDGLFIPVAGNAVYNVTAITPDGSITESIFIGLCEDATFGCTNPYASNYDPDADEDDGTCTYDETICDCEGTEHTIGVLTWLGDGFADQGEFNWDGQPVNFNCSIWGYDCGDIEGGEGDPYDVCSGGLPPNNGCGIDEIFGCTDAEADNYNPNATVDDGTCVYPEDVYGCTDSEASNYNPNATVDNGTCEYLIYGCTDPDATNYNPLATTDNGSCIYTDIFGCTDPNANNYDPFATVDDGSCAYGCILPEVNITTVCDEDNPDGFYLEFEVVSIGTGAPYNVTNNANGQSLVLNLTGTFTFGPFDNDEVVVLSVASVDSPDCSFISDVYSDNCFGEEIEGCTDEDAINYDEDATVDDGSCVYECVYPIINYTTVCEDGEEDVFYVEMEVTSLGNGAPYDIYNNVNDETLSLNFIGTISLGPYENNAQVLYTLESEILEACFLTSPVLTDDCTPEEIEGCMDPLATNYNADATVDDGSCEYDFTICDCVGNVYSPSVLSQLGDGIPNEDIVNFNCETWGYDCGDIDGAPGDDPFDVCDGELPPLFGCSMNIDEIGNATFEMFPNPTDGRLTIVLQGFDTEVRLEVYNSIGSLVQMDAYNSSEFIQLDLTNQLSNGVYLVRISDDHRSVERRVLLNK